MQATADNKKAAILVGIRVDRVYMLTFAISGAVGGAAAVLMAPLTMLYTDLGFALFLKAFAAAVLGGLTSVPGASSAAWRSASSRRSPPAISAPACRMCRPSSSSCSCWFACRPDCWANAARGSFRMRSLLGGRAFLIAVFAVLALLPVVTNPYFVYVSNLVLIYILLATGPEPSGWLRRATGVRQCGDVGDWRLWLRPGSAASGGAVLPRVAGGRHAGDGGGHHHRAAGFAAEGALSGAGDHRLRRIHSLDIHSLGQRDAWRRRVSCSAGLLRAVAGVGLGRNLLPQLDRGDRGDGVRDPVDGVAHRAGAGRDPRQRYRGGIARDRFAAVQGAGLRAQRRLRRPRGRTGTRPYWIMWRRKITICCRWSCKRR